MRELFALVLLSLGPLAVVLFVHDASHSSLIFAVVLGVLYFELN